mmetsp:Transcript_1531/g.3798  ORF Transcript_1531/g.3798 Transcript_1531/m.3798 type:complete len:244 (-) Transcript_1531:484-1215(-)
MLLLVMTRAWLNVSVPVVCRIGSCPRGRRGDRHGVIAGPRGSCACCNGGRTTSRCWCSCSLRIVRRRLVDLPVHVRARVARSVGCRCSAILAVAVTVRLAVGCLAVLVMLMILMMRHLVVPRVMVVVRRVPVAAIMLALMVMVLETTPAQLVRGMKSPPGSVVAIAAASWMVRGRVRQRAKAQIHGPHGVGGETIGGRMARSGCVDVAVAGVHILRRGGGLILPLERVVVVLVVLWLRRRRRG